MILVSYLVFVVPRVDDTFDNSRHVVLWLSVHVIANILADVLENSSVSAIVILGGARSSVNACDISQVLVPSQCCHS